MFESGRQWYHRVGLGPGYTLIGGLPGSIGVLYIILGDFPFFILGGFPFSNNLSPAAATPVDVALGLQQQQIAG